MTNIALIRKFAMRELGRKQFEDIEDPIAELRLHKAASAEDRELLKMAADLPGDTLEVYEALGGKYKTAFGQPMFQPVQTQVPGMGAAAGGVDSVKLPMPKPVGMAGPKMPGMGQQQGTVNPMQQASTPKIPGTSSTGGNSGSA